MKNKITRKQMILSILKNPDTKLTCQQLCKKIIKKQKLTDNIAHYLSGSISSILNKMVKDGILKYAKEVGVKGGYVYQLNKS